LDHCSGYGLDTVDLHHLIGFQGTGKAAGAAAVHAILNPTWTPVVAGTVAYRPTDIDNVGNDTTDKRFRVTQVSQVLCPSVNLIFNLVI
jgi:phage/plasmid primase-like uncharacterized protein